ncbi:coiled-coil-helix-coiled-coil-helix domain-containing protein 1 [Hemicordylus capensis]|uniref:coiled-coil-helix-coiled-coil-helix domain-containing protein 1 n=1 Tax=Hemicordylus capensis TaxID=884348 RepID=UPI002303FA2A|nr:coiled-coil-helix-coiled-coil-helix domain-containing protein 1 [Hemicordylus capensis]
MENAPSCPGRERQKQQGQKYLGSPILDHGMVVTLGIYRYYESTYWSWVALRLGLGCRESSDMAVPPPSYPAWVTRLSELRRGGQRPGPVRVARPLILADRVSNRRMRLGEATCITEMSLMMACWKKNEFSDTACAKEIQTFFDCTAKAEEEWKESVVQEALGRSGKLGTKQINKLLKQFPNITQHY